MTQQQATALRLVCNAVIESVQEAGAIGVPGGLIYAGMMAHGATFEQYEIVMNTLVAAGKLRRSGDLYFMKGES